VKPPATTKWWQKLHLGTVLGIVVALYISVYLVQTVKRNYELQTQISKLQTQIGDLQIESDQLKYKIQYYQTDAYKEKEARAKLGLQAPGEGVIILPHGEEQANQQDDQKTKKSAKSNLQQWQDFLLGRP
jgi:cell division protein FtsL